MNSEIFGCSSMAEDMKDKYSFILNYESWI